MVRILFVCLGNICRSPLAEAIFNHKIFQKQLQNHFQAESCGTANYHIGDQPDPRTIRNALKNGVSIDHLGRQFSITDFDQFDLILPMDSSNYSSLTRLLGAQRFLGKVRLMRTFESPNQGRDVPDPYYGNEADFQEVFEILNRSIEGLVEFLENDPEAP